MLKRSLATLLTLAFILSSAACVKIKEPLPSETPAVSDSQTLPDTEIPFALTILHTNDVHGHYAVEENGIGHDVIATIFDTYNADRNNSVLLLDAGDATQGIYFVGESRGEAAIDIMNSVGYDAMAIGNHEFDYGWLRLTELAKLAKFPLLLDNTISENAENFYPYTVVERAGFRIGIFGITTPETQFKSIGAFNKNFGDIISVIDHSRKMVSELRMNENVDLVVCLSHLGIEDMGYGTSYDIRDNVEGIDIIIDGHSHTVLDDIVQADGKTIITSTGTADANLGVIEFAANPDGKLVPAQVRLIPKADTVGIPPKSDVTEVINKWALAVEAEGSRVVAQIPFDISIERANERTRETIMGNILTDAMIAASGADIAIQNGGGIRDQQLSAGDLTKAQLITVLPFGNVLQMAEVSGAVVKDALEVGVSLYPDASGGFAHVSGLSYTFDPAAPVGQRITSISIAGLPIDPAKTYKLATNDFTAAGGDKYDMLKAPFARQLPIKEAGISAMEEVLIWYFNSNPTLSNQLQGRILEVTTD